MFKKSLILGLFLALAANYTVFSQGVTIDTALSTATKEIAESVPKGTKIAVLNITSDYAKLADYIIDELIVNLVGTRQFQVVPRSEVELKLALGEFDFQKLTGYVSDEAQKSLGQFLGAGTIISGSVTRDSANSYRIVVNAINLESFTYQSSYRIAVKNDKQMKELIATSSGGMFNDDYTIGERLGMGALNILGGTGSIINGQKIGWITFGVEVVGLLVIAWSGVPYIPEEPVQSDDRYLYNNQYASDKNEYDNAVKEKNGIIATGVSIIGAGVVFGFAIPFFHHKQNDSVSDAANNFPFNFELASSNNRDIDGFTLSYSMKL